MRNLPEPKKRQNPISLKKLVAAVWKINLLEQLDMLFLLLCSLQK